MKIMMMMIRVVVLMTMTMKMTIIILMIRFWSSWSTGPLLYLSEPLQDPDKIIGLDNHLLIIFRIIRCFCW